MMHVCILDATADTHSEKPITSIICRRAVKIADILRSSTAEIVYKLSFSRSLPCLEYRRPQLSKRRDRVYTLVNGESYGIDN